MLIVAIMPWDDRTTHCNKNPPTAPPSASFPTTNNVLPSGSASRVIGTASDPLVFVAHVGRYDDSMKVN
jgi:hypothetical protein